jgi:hypothetical protein
MSIHGRPFESGAELLPNGKDQWLAITGRPFRWA